MSSCGECGFVYDALALAAIPEAIASFGPRYRAALEGGRGVLARRPDATTWSALEYACHVRDVLLVQRDRAIHALVADVPGFAPMHRDERADLAVYASEDPETVAGELAMASRLLSRLFARLTDQQLARRCIYNFPAPAEVDIAWLGRHTVHEGEHHLGDLTRVVQRVS